MISTPKVGRVTIEYVNGMTITHEGESLEQWMQTYTEGQLARIQLQNLIAQTEHPAPAGEPAHDGPPSNIRSLRDEINKRRADSE